MSHLGWSLVWGLVGILLILVGIAVIVSPILGLIQEPVNYYSYGVLVSSMIFALIFGIILIIIGALVISLSAVATFFKINSEIVAEETKRLIEAPKITAKCPNCGSELRYIDTYKKWYCDKEGKYL